MVKKTKIWLSISGVLMIVLGILALVYPEQAVNAIAWLIGIMTLASGISILIFTLRTQMFLPNSGTRMLTALLQIVIGCFFLFNNWLLTISLPFAFALWIMFEGVSMFVRSFDYKRYGFKGWWGIMLLGIAVVVLGFFAMRYPAGSAEAIAITAGIGAIIVGIGDFVAFSSLAKIEKRFEPIRQRMEEVKEKIEQNIE